MMPTQASHWRDYEPWNRKLRGFIFRVSPSFGSVSMAANPYVYGFVEPFEFNPRIYVVRWLCCPEPMEGLRPLASHLDARNGFRVSMLAVDFPILEAFPPGVWKGTLSRQEGSSECLVVLQRPLPVKWNKL